MPGNTTFKKGKHQVGFLYCHCIPIIVVDFGPL
jgi:hypothetical protein